MRCGTKLTVNSQLAFHRYPPLLYDEPHSSDKGLTSWKLPKVKSSCLAFPVLALHPLKVGQCSSITSWISGKAQILC